MQWNEWDSGQNAGMRFTETSAHNEAPKYIFKHQKGWQFCRSVKQLWQWRHQGEPQYLWQPLCSPPAELPPWSRPWMTYSFILYTQIPPGRIKRFSHCTSAPLFPITYHGWHRSATQKMCCVKKRRKERRNLINTPLFPAYIMQNLAWNLYHT